MPGNNSIEEWAAKSAEGQAANLEAADAARHLGALAFYDNTNQALAAYRKAVGLDAGNPDGWNQLGHLLVRIGELKDAEEAYGKVKAIAESLSDRQWLAIAYGNLGIVYQTRGALAQAEEMQKKSLALNKALGRKEGMANVYTNFGIIYKIRENLTQADEIHKKALAIFEALSHEEGIASVYISMENHLDFSVN